ncbi:MAG: hypothetical protein OEX11_07750 [Nitrosomonas sp.]|nr:hypothetical protein [Nitrosomonas sp.]
METEIPSKELKAKLKNRSWVRKVFFISVLAFILIWCVGAFILVDELIELRNYLFYAALFVWVVILASGLYLHNAKCPRCGNKYSAQPKWPYMFNTFSRKCINCGLKLDGSYI